MIDKKKYLKYLPERPCPLCQGVGRQVLSRRMQFGLDCTTVICRWCGFCYVSPPPTREAYADFYREAYAWFYCKIHSTAKPGQLVENRFETARLDAIERLVPLAGARVVEIGPGYGRFLQLVANRGAKISAIEPSQTFRESLQKNGVEILGEFLETTATSQQFDIIMLFQVLEHFHDPVDAVQRVRKLLAPNGIVVLDVPNIWKPFRNLDRYFLRYVHLSYFSPQTLKRLFAGQGFECLALDEGGHSIYSANALYGIFRPTNDDVSDLAACRDDWQQLLKYLESYRRRYAIVDAPRLGVFQFRRSIRRGLSRSPLGALYRNLKAASSKAGL